MSKKLIICFEGVDASGKSLHLKNAALFLKKKKIPFLKLREPGGTKNSEKIRKLILSNKSTFNKKTDLLLYFAARNENIENVINKNYKKKVILIDRFTDSTIAYQHYGMKINKKIIHTINSYLLNKIKIDFTFLHIVNDKNLKLRISKRNILNRYDKFSYPFYKRVQAGFINQSKLNKKKYLIVNSNNKIGENKKIIIKKLQKLIKI